MISSSKGGVNERGVPGDKDLNSRNPTGTGALAVLCHSIETRLTDHADVSVPACQYPIGTERVSRFPKARPCIWCVCGQDS